MLHENTVLYIWLLFFMTAINWSEEQAFYDPTSCSQIGSYTCTNTTSTCPTFLIFRANARFPTISAVATIFGSPPDTLLRLNRINHASEVLLQDREVLVPVTCSCSAHFFNARINYTVTQTTTLSDIACGVFEGLVNQQGQNHQDVVQAGFVRNLPFKCSCPDVRYKYLVTYPLVSGDSVVKVSTKFGISKDDVLEANSLHPDTTVYPNTTILVPLRSEPAIAFDVPTFQPLTTGFLPTKPVEGNVKQTKLKKVYIIVAVIGSGLVLAILIVSALYVNALSKCKRHIFVIPSTHRSSFTSFSTPRVSSPRSPVTRSSPSSCLSPDLLAGIKYSLYNFTIEEIKRATRDFSQECKESEDGYRGLFDDVQVLIKEIEFSEIRHVIDLHSKINHVNVVKLLGVCYNESSWSYLVLEHPSNGSLSDCLITSSSSLTWQRRTQIAFDVAMGLHYLHYCIVPPYMQTGLGIEKIFVTAKWRAKLTVLSRNTNPGIGGSSGSEYENSDALRVSEKENILEFGMVLVAILSGKVKIEKRVLRESIGFLGREGSERGCFGDLRSFMDPCLKEEYPLAEALCLGVLAKACVESDPFHRPSMEDILKVLARMV